jgi:hypothetical protein
MGDEKKVKPVKTTMLGSALDGANRSMDLLAQREYVESLKRGVPFAFRYPNGFYYLLRQNMIEPTLRDKYAKNTPYIIWCELIDPIMMEPVELHVRPLSEKRVHEWIKVVSEIHAQISK